MRQKSGPESHEQRRQRLEKKIQERILAGEAEERTIDEMVKRSIGLHGP